MFDRFLIDSTLVCSQSYRLKPKQNKRQVENLSFRRKRVCGTLARTICYHESSATAAIVRLLRPAASNEVVSYTLPGDFKYLLPAEQGRPEGDQKRALASTYEVDSDNESEHHPNQESPYQQQQNPRSENATPSLNTKVMMLQLQIFT